MPFFKKLAKILKKKKSLDTDNKPGSSSHGSDSGLRLGSRQSISSRQSNDNQPSIHSFLDAMTIVVEIWRQGPSYMQQQEDELVSIALSSIIRSGYENAPHLANSYGLVLFTSNLEHSMHINAPNMPAETKYGRLSYFDHRDEHRDVENQKDFEEALSILYMSRGTNDVLCFHFQPEGEEDRAVRLEAKRKKAQERAERAARKRAAELGEDFTPTEDLPPEDDSVLEDASKTPLPPIPVVVWDGSKRLERTRSVTFRDDGPSQELKLVRASTFDGKVHPGEGRKSQEIIRPPSSQGSPIKEKKNSITETAKKLIGSGKKPEKETLQQRNARFKKLYVQEATVSYMTGGGLEDVGEEDEGDEEVETPAQGQGKQRVEEGAAGDVEEEIVEEVEPQEIEEDDDVSNEDRMAAKVKALLALDELTQLKDPKDVNGKFTRWEECCRLFGRNPEDTKIDQYVRITGLKTRIYQYQAFGVYWQMVTSRKYGGGFVADDMGLGKTLSFLAYFVVERQLAVLWREVEASRKAKDGKHLLEDEPDETKECPRAWRPGWIACPCAKSSPSSELEPQPGLRMACVPPKLIQTWWKQWKEHIDVDTDANELGLTIAVNHPGAFGIQTSMQDRLSNAEGARNLSLMKAKKPKQAKAEDIPEPRQEGFLLLTTAESYPKLEKKFETEGQVHDPKAAGSWKSGKRVGLVFGIAMTDESHEQPLKGQGRAGLLAKLPRGSSSVQPFIWGYSGTPFTTPRGIEGVLWAIESHSTQHGKVNPKFLKFEHKKLDDICKRYTRLAKDKKRDDAAVDQILTEFKTFLTALMIRRTPDTQWFGHDLMMLKPHIHQDIRLKPISMDYSNGIRAFEEKFESERSEELEKLQANWDNNPDQRRTDRPTKLSFPAECTKKWRSRLLASFPYLLNLSNEVEVDASGLTLSEEEVRGFTATEAKEKESPYTKHIKDIVESSPKCMWLHAYIMRLEKETDINGNPQKLIILTKFPQVAFILKQFIKKYFPKKECGMIVGGMKAREKDTIIDGFTDALDDRGHRKVAKDIQILIGMTLYIGTGLHLTRACNVVLMEPDFNFEKVEMQGYKRVNRIGQKNPYSWSYRLIDSGSDIEQRILKRQRDRKQFPGRQVSGDVVDRCKGDQLAPEEDSEDGHTEEEEKPVVVKGKGKEKK